MAKFVLSVVIVALFTVFILQNAFTVTLTIAWWEVSVHLILLLLLLFVAGVFTGWWLGSKRKGGIKEETILNKKSEG